MSEVTLVRLRSDYPKLDINGLICTDTYTLARSLNAEQLAELLDDWLNSSFGSQHQGITIGLKLRRTHRTLQGSLVEFVLGILRGISQQEHTDARNETAIETAKEITRLLEEGKLKHQMFI